MKIKTDICIVGAGPIGLFAVFQAGLLKMRCQVFDALPQVGGQLSEMYTHNHIYHIEEDSHVPAQGLIDDLMEQIKPFQPRFTLGESIEELACHKDGSFTLSTNRDTQIDCKAIVITDGFECFDPLKHVIENIDLCNAGLSQDDELDYQTNIPGVFTIGNSNNYPDKMKFFLSGSHEAALVSQNAFKYIYPLKNLRFKSNGLNIRLI